MNELMILGAEHPGSWWDEHNPPGNCAQCGGQCDGTDCGLHAAGCVYGGLGYGYWTYSKNCPLFHGETNA